MKKILIIFMLFLFFYLPSKYSFCEDLSANSIVNKSFYRDDGNDRYSKAEMTLIDKRGNKRIRILSIYSKDYGELMKTFLKFLSPPDIDGTKFLSIENKGTDDTQYLYLPALGRARRIVSNQKRLSFVNTDYTYEDMQRRRPDKDVHTILREDNINGYDCYVIESIPEKGSSQYSKRISWIEKESYVVLKTDFYGKKGKMIKEFKVTKLDKIQDIWTAIESVMEDFKQKHTTIIKLIDVKYNQGLDDNMFTVYHFENE